MLVLFIGAAILLAIDLVTKAVFYARSGFTVIPKVLSVEPITPNQGAAFGIFQGGVGLLVIATLVILVVGAFFYWKFKQGRNNLVFNIGCAFVLGGALGNLWDRIFNNGVRDFLQFEFINFPVFNFADVFLNIGMVLLVIYFIFIFKEKKSATRD